MVVGISRLWGVLPWTAVPVTAAVVGAVVPAPVLLYNPSPSLPIGYYLRASAPPARGRIIAFHVPAPGRAYATAHIPYVVRGAIIKPVVAAAGDRVCTGDQLKINDHIVASIAKLDRQGRPLPQWRDCRVLRRDEYFVFSNRIPNSFDSRYYGPVAQSDVISTFRPLWTRTVL
jgi:conjugative transfer signal peptidase TraF